MKRSLIFLIFLSTVFLQGLNAGHNDSTLDLENKIRSKISSLKKCDNKSYSKSKHRISRCCGRGPRGHRGFPGRDGIIGVNGVAGATGATGSSGVTGAMGAAGVTGSTGPAGVTGATGPAFPDLLASLDFNFIPFQNTSSSGLWHAFVISPDQTKYFATPPFDSIDITAATPPFTITVPPPIKLGPYAIVLYSDTIDQTQPTNVVTQVTVTNSAHPEITLYNFFSVLGGTGTSQQFFYNAYNSPTGPSSP